jgi:glycylpeptide N-tetradecanoyltransferase
MPDESKLDDPTVAKEAAEEVIAESATSAQAEVDTDNEEDDAAGTTTSATSGPAAKKKKSKKKRIKSALSGGSSSTEAGSAREEIDKAVNSLSKKDIDELLKMNPALAAQLGVNEGSSMSSAAEALKKLKLEDIMTGLAASGKNVKDMGSYKFWGTQPVPKFGETGELKEGPLKEIDPEQVPKEPGPLVDGFEWVTMDLLDEKQLQEVFELLYGHFVEDDEGMFRFNYSKPFLRW